MCIKCSGIVPYPQEKIEGGVVKSGIIHYFENIGHIWYISFGLKTITNAMELSLAHTFDLHEKYF